MKRILTNWFINEDLPSKRSNVGLDNVVFSPTTMYNSTTKTLIDYIPTGVPRRTESLISNMVFARWFYSNVVLDILLNHKDYSMYNTPILHHYNVLSDDSTTLELELWDVNRSMLFNVTVIVRDGRVDLSFNVMSTAGEPTHKFESFYILSQYNTETLTPFRSTEEFDRFSRDLNKAFKLSKED